MRISDWSSDVRSSDLADYSWTVLRIGSPAGNRAHRCKGWRRPGKAPFVGITFMGAGTSAGMLQNRWHPSRRPPGLTPGRAQDEVNLWSHKERTSDRKSTRLNSSH